MKKLKVIICDNCGKKGARIRRITKSYGKGKNILLIENVPIITCPHCGVSYLEAETLHEIERIKLHKNNFAVEHSIPVAEYRI